MSDRSISIVPRISTVKSKEIVIEKALEWLFALDVVSPIKSDCTLGKNLGYSVSKGAKKVVVEPEFLPFQLIWNGLVIDRKRTIFHANELDSLFCPNCTKDISEEDWDFFNEWYNKESDNLTCPKCKHGNEIHLYSYEPSWGFSDLGFVFWNWPMFKKGFIREFEKKIEYEVDVVFFRL